MKIPIAVLLQWEYIYIYMFIECEKKRLPFIFGEAEMWLRYDNAAFLNIEKTGLDPFDIYGAADNPKAVRAFLYNGLLDWYSDKPGRAPLNEYINRLMSADDFSSALIEYIQIAIMLALPQPVKGIKQQANGKRADATALFTLFVDIMHREECEFWNSTLREVHERWERYAVANGMKKPVEEFRQYDDD